MGSRLNYYFYNMDYFFKEVKISIQMNLLPGFFSFVSIGLILFILAMITSGWWISAHVIEVIQGEAEINVYFDENIGETGTARLVENIKKIRGTREARVVDQQEAYDRMVEILGKEARVLEVFDDNPFTSYIEVNIHLEEIDLILDKLQSMAGIEYIRDNRDILNRLHNIAGLLSFIGYLALASVGISTLIITSHIIRLGIYTRRDQINTLRLLGSPEGFIAFPFLLEGILLALGGGIMAVVMMTFMINFIYAQISGTLPFIPLLSRDSLISGLTVLISCLSLAFGFIGSLLGLSSAKKI
ncbi:MAG: hypothetical protein CVU88_00615 [Firmicutes bacterium HGW-Firmicutes-13]|nr:MAG: hypothetical protein CVU88_00615 [Firmicutes bacterium HGW-Firmicutes-13]